MKQSDLTNAHSVLCRETIQSILAEHDTRAKKHFGQNFLTNRDTLDRIVTAAQLQPTDTILEIGPGIGALTHELCARAHHVTAIETDPDMVAILHRTCPAKNLTIVNDDALTIDITADPANIKQPYKLIANLPYNIATPLLTRFLMDDTTHHAKSHAQPIPQPTRIVVLVQKEVAEKICARTGDHNMLSLTIQPFGMPKIIAHIPPSHFTPAPKVTSAILLIEPCKTPSISPADWPAYHALIAAAFSQKRKTLANSLQKLMPKATAIALLIQVGIKPETRPQNLDFNGWLRLLNAITKAKTLTK